jgi:4-amino-4-deoxy-L-arabinose transferase-like glycosyltransferase
VLPRRAPDRTPDLFAVLSAGAVVLFLVVVLASQPYFPTYDESKYLSIGANLWAGRGLVTAFGDPFLSHAPLWSAVLYAPTAIAHADAFAWGHLLDAAAGAGVVAIAAIMARRASPLASVIAASAMLGFTYLLDLSRTTRLDAPVAFFAMLYLEVGWRAVTSRSARWALAAGVTFALGVWIKEVPIPLAPAPMLAGILDGQPWTQVGRAAGRTTLTATALLLPWFVLYADATGLVYRLGTPAWTLGPVRAAVVLLGALSASAERLAARGALRDRLRAGGNAFVARVPRLRQHGRALVGWGGTLLWAAALLLFFSHIGRIGEGGLFQAEQIRHNLSTWFTALAPVAAFAGAGLLLAGVLLVADPGAAERSGVQTAVIATLCGAPLVIMVIAVGEPPRNYIAQVAIAVVAAAGGWAWAAARAVRRATAGRGPAIARRASVALAVVAVTLGSGATAVRAWDTREGSGATTPQAVDTTVAWIRAHVPRGTTVAFGAYLSFSLADRLVPDYRLVQLQARLTTADPTYPEAFRYGKEAPSTDWVAADTAPRNVNQYEAFRASWIADEVANDDITTWVYATGADTAAPSILGQLTPDHGFSTEASWTFGSGKDAIQITVFAVDPAAIRLDPGELFISPAALQRVTTKLATQPVQAKPAAGLLLDRVEVIPSSPAADASLGQLRALAGR